VRCGHLLTVTLAVGYALQSAQVRADRIPAAELRVELEPDGGIVVPVYIRGTGPHRFLLDTGASHTAMSDRLAATLGLDAVAKAEVVTAAGAVTRTVVTAKEVAVGTATVDVLLPTTVDSATLEVAGRALAGVLGQDFLSQFNFTIDYRTRRLWWTADDVPGGGIRLVLRPSGGRFVVELQQVACGCPVSLVPDSGAQGLVLYAGTNADRLPVERSAISMRVSTLAGAGTAATVVLRELRVGQTTLWNQTAARIPAGADRADGLLPLHVFGRVSFNNRDSYMIVEPR
jgi:predicted aspartyl protease